MWIGHQCSLRIANADTLQHGENFLAPFGGLILRVQCKPLSNCRPMVMEGLSEVMGS